MYYTSLEDLMGERQFVVVPNNPVTNPSHYNLNRKGIECIAAMEAMLSEEEFIGYLRGNIFKYQWRFRYKGHAVQDLEKAQWYSDKLLEKVKEHGEKANTSTE